MKVCIKFITLFFLVFYSGISYTQNLFPFKKSNKWGLINSENQIVVEPTFSSIEEIYPNLDMLVYNDTNGFKGIYNYKTKTIELNPSEQYQNFKTIDYLPYFLIRGKNLKLAVYDIKQRKFLTDYDIEYTAGIINDTLLKAAKNKMLGLFNLKSKKYILECKYERIDYGWEEFPGGSGGISKTTLKLFQNGKFALYDLVKQRFITEFIFEGIEEIFPDKTMIVKRNNQYTIYSIKDKKYILSKNYSGKIKFITDYTYVLPQNDSSYLFDAKQNKVLVKDKYIEALIPYTRETTLKAKYVKYGNELLGVYSLVSGKNIIPNKYAFISYHQTENQDKTNKNLEFYYFKCQQKRDRYAYHFSYDYFDEKGIKIPEEKMKAISNEDFYAVEGVGDMGDYDRLANQINIKKISPKAFKIIRTISHLNKIDSVILTGYDTLFTISDYGNKFKLKTEHNDTNSIFLGRILNVYELLSFRGKVMAKIECDSIFTDNKLRSKILLYSQNDQFGIINLHYDKYLTNAFFTKIESNMIAYIGSSFLLLANNKGDAFYYNIISGKVYHPDISLRLLRFK